MLKLKVKRFHPNAKLPEVAHPGEDFGYDVFACLDVNDYPDDEVVNLVHREDALIIAPGEQKLVRIGWAMEVESAPGILIPHPCGLIAKQPSGMALKRFLDVKAGVIDAGYRNEIKILLYNYGTTVQYIRHHDKIAQLVPIKVMAGLVEEVDALSPSERGIAGWGSGAKSGC